MLFGPTFYCVLNWERNQFPSATGRPCANIDAPYYIWATGYRNFRAAQVAAQTLNELFPDRYFDASLDHLHPHPAA